MLKGYPKTVVIRDGTRVTLRPMVKEDGERLREFFADIPEEDRWYLREDVADARVIDSWVRDLNYERVFPILAQVDDRIVADATLHRHTFGGSRHVAKLRIVIAPEYRRKGLGTWLALDIVNLALECGVEKLVAELVEGKQEAAIEGLLRLGFVKEARLYNYARDPQGEPHDLVMMVRTFYPDWGTF
jgi:ribosomal protein S18 acetylase RimI-like enzyme